MSTIEIQTNFGNIKIELYADKAPKTVANFLSYIESDFFKDTLFHRVIPNFMIQGGGFDKQFTQKTTQDAIENEADNGLTNVVGSIAMARTGDPHSATSQFFINTSDNDFLNFKSKTPQGWGYCVFGQTVAGEDVISAISEVATGMRAGHQDVPKEEVVIEKITLL